MTILPLTLTVLLAAYNDEDGPGVARMLDYVEGLRALGWTAPAGWSEAELDELLASVDPGYRVVD